MPRVSHCAAAVWSPNVSEVPAAYGLVGGYVLSAGDNSSYADRLSRAGVLVEFHLDPRAYHGSQQVTHARGTEPGERSNLRHHDAS